MERIWNEKKESETCNVGNSLPTSELQVVCLVISHALRSSSSACNMQKDIYNWIQTGDKWNKMYKNQQTRTSKSFKLISGIWSCFWCSIPPTTSSRHTCQATGAAIPKWLDTQDNSSSNWRHTHPKPENQWKSFNSVKILQACTRPMPSCPGEDSGPLGSALPNPAVPSSACNDWIAYVDSHKHQHNTSTWPATMRIGQWHFQFLVQLRFHPGRSM